MERLLQRERYGGGFSLFAKFELTPDEADKLSRSRVRQEVIWEDPLGDAKKKMYARFLGAVALGVSATVLMYFISYLDGRPDQRHLGMWLMYAVISIPVWLLVSRYVFQRERERLTVRDVLKGRTIRGDEESLRLKEQAIIEASLKIKAHLDGWKAGGEWGGTGERTAL